MAVRARPHGTLQRWWLKLTKAWFAVQLTQYGGKYSIERMLAFEEYTQSTSAFRAVCVSAGLPLLLVAVVLLQECIPLQDPAAGWGVNYGFWVRVGITGTAVGNAAAVMIAIWLEVPELSSRQRLVFSVWVGVGYVVAGMVASEIWVFPVPFFFNTVSMVLPSVFAVSLRVVVGTQAFRTILSRKEQWRRLTRIAMLQGFMYGFYPVFEVVFGLTKNTNYELPVILLLPVLKLLMKFIFTVYATHREDIVPSQVVFTVDFYNAFYMATFLQNISPTSLIVIMAVDLLQTAIELQELHDKMRRIFTRLARINGGQPAGFRDNLLVQIRKLYGCLSALASFKTDAQVRSHKPHKLTREGVSLLEKLAVVEEKYRSRVESSMKSYAFGPTEGALRSAVVQPWRQAIVPEHTTTSAQRVKSQLSDAILFRALEEALQVLFTSECLVLTEYVEVIIPAFYGVFVAVMAQLPSARYHSEMDDVDINNASTIAAKLLLYAALETCSFIVLAVVTKRTSSIRALYQLAFVLEQEASLVVSTLVLWTLLTLTYRVEHFGVDFSFKFEWIKRI